MHARFSEPRAAVTMQNYLMGDLTMLPSRQCSKPVSAVGSAALGRQPFAPPLLPRVRCTTFRPTASPPVPGGEPFAPPRGESAVTSWFTRQLQNFDKMSASTLTLPCTMVCRAHALSRVNCTTSFAVRSGSAWAHSLRAHSLHGAAVLAGLIQDRCS